MFEVLQENNCKVIYGLDHDFLGFIRNATIGKKLLSLYLQEQYYNY
jgi:pyrroloquinoline quinone (PQQ) biosynthesis protein C